MAPKPLHRDPWAWVVLLAVAPLVLRSLGAPLGEPFADDFDYLYRALLVRRGGWFDGYGSTLYWRPFGRQLYFELLAPVIAAHPLIVPLLHSALLAAAGVLVYRALRPLWPAPSAACAGSFIALSESSRMLIAWPSHFMDLGAIVFAAVALHAATRRRMAASAAGLLASLLTKEVGVLAGLLLPWTPTPGVTRAQRVRWMLVVASVVAAWGVAYVRICARAGLAVPGDAAASVAALPARFAWAAWNSLRAAFSLPASPSPHDTAIVAALACIGVLGVARFATSAPARARVRGMMPWILFGLAWFVLATAPLVQVYPAWAPYRSAFGAVGLGIALAGALGALHPGLLVALIAVRLAALGLAPPAAQRVDVTPTETGAAFDFQRLTRLERLSREMRELLHARFPHLKPQSVIGLENLPRLTEYALSGDRAIRTWYRDTTLRMVRVQAMSERELAAAAAVVEYSPEDEHSFSIVRPGALLVFMRAVDALSNGHTAEARDGLARARALQRGEVAPGFESALRSIEALPTFEQGQADSTEVRGVPMPPPGRPRGR